MKIVKYCECFPNVYYTIIGSNVVNSVCSCWCQNCAV